MRFVLKRMALGYGLFVTPSIFPYPCSVPMQPDRCKDLASRTVVGFDWTRNREVILRSLRLLIKYDGARIKINFISNK